MTSRNTVTTLAAVKLGIFTIVSVLVTGLLAVIMGHLGFGARTEYKALFSSASELKKGDDVRVAGVSVGEVENVALAGRDHAVVTFKVDSAVPMTTASGAEVRYLNLVGDRYLALSQGTPGAPRLQPDATIPMSRTTPALNLTELFNGFQPLFQALTPKDVNDLALNLVRVLQGEGGTVQSLLAHTASLTNTLADRDQLIGEVVRNLSGTVQTVDAHHRQLEDLLVQLRGWLGHLATDRQTIGASVQNVSLLTDEVARLVSGVRPFAKEDIAQLRRVMAILNRPANQKLLSDTLPRLPTTLRRQARIGTFGSWYNYYLCDFTGRVILPKLGSLLGLGAAGKALDARIASLQAEVNKNMSVHSTAKRCAG
jgi:phospholipid/cholesterol/gamma-HCH transport system substrate-binding protein